MIDDFLNKKIVTRKMLENSELWDSVPEILKDMKPRQILWHLKHETNSPPKCKNCGKELLWVHDQNTYRTYCSAKCRANCNQFKKAQVESNLEKYGVEHHFQSECHKSKRNETMLEKYGYKYNFQNEDIHNYAKQQNSKYGNKNRSKTLKQRYGVSSIAHINLPDNVLSILNNKDDFTSYITRMTPGSLSSLLKVDRNTIINYIKKYNIDNDLICKKSSSLENEISNFINSLGVNYILNDRNVISPYEIDIFIPKYNIGIECNGDYWHSDKFKDKNYHYKKWIMAKENNIRIIQIYECDWYSSPSKFKNLIKSVLNQKSKGVGARKCKVRLSNASEVRSFINKYHIQNFVGGTHFGAYDSENELVGVMTFGWTRGSKLSRRFELKRWVTDNRTHPGLFSKVFKFAQRELQFDQVVSFSMNDWFDGKVYEKCGFVKHSIIKPAYFYVYNSSRTHCSAFTKKMIKRKLPQFYNEKLSERAMMQNANILRCWDSGKIEWIWRINE